MGKQGYEGVKKFAIRKVKMGKKKEKGDRKRAEDSDGKTLGDTGNECDEDGGDGNDENDGNDNDDDARSEFSLGELGEYGNVQL